MWDSYLKEAGGDSISAHAAMESDVLLYSGEVIDLEADLRKAVARGDRLATWYDEEHGNWFERLWDSDAMKTIIFVAGVWLGIYASGV